MVAEAWFQDHICPKQSSEIPIRNSTFKYPVYQNKEFGEGQREKLREISQKEKANFKASFKESNCSPTSSYS